VRSLPASGIVWLNPALFLLAALALALRSLDSFVHPIAGWEDATEGINIYGGPAGPVFHRYAGYLEALPQLLNAVVFRLLPLHLAPYAQAIIALLIAALLAPAGAGFLRQVFALPARRAAWIALTVSLLPVGGFAFVSVLNFAVWNLVALLMLSAAAPVPLGAFGRVWYVGWRVMALASTPVSAVMAPFWLIRFIRANGIAERLVFAALLSALCSYFAFAIDHSSTGLASRAPEAAATALRLAGDKSLFWLTLRGVFGINLGTPPLVITALGLFAVAIGIPALVLFRARDPAWPARHVLWPVVLTLAGIFLLCALCAAGRGDHGAAFVLAAPRYAYIQRLLWSFLVAGLVARLWPRTVRFRRAAAVCAIAAVASLNVHATKIYRTDNRVESAAVLGFLRKAETDPSAPRRFPRVTQDGDWSIVLRD
jgi:hypothetical protein